MIAYLDTSVVVALLTADAHNDRALDWVASQDDAVVASSDWVMTEYSSVLSAKLRGGDLDESERDAALSRFARLRQESVTWLAVESGHFLRAADLANRSQLPLRGSDALHLALSQALGATLVTLDKRQSKAGAALGVATLLL